MPPQPLQGSPHPSFIARQIRDYRYFFLDLDPVPRSSLTVACGGWEQCASDYRVERADFGFHGIEYVAGGRGRLRIGRRESELVPGCVFAYQPFTKHRIESSPADPLVKYFVDFSGRNAAGLIGKRVFAPRGVVLLHQAQPIHDLFEEMLETGARGGKRAPRFCALLLELLALRIEENALRPGGARDQSRETFERCRAELIRHFRTIHSVAEWAAASHLDPAYMSRLCQRFARESPHAMLTRMKMNEAAAHLVGGRLSVKETAAKVGFADPYHFSRIFKNLYGMPPSRFLAHRVQARPKISR
jgi:AraC-like DNA-binding protein